MAIQALIILITALAVSLTASAPIKLINTAPSMVPSPNELVVKVANGTVSDPNFLEVQQSQDVLQKTYRTLGQNGTVALVESDVESADVFWRGILTNNTAASNPNHGEYKGAVVAVQGYADEGTFNPTTVLQWFVENGIGFPNMFQATSPEHYLAFGPNGEPGGDPSVVILSVETWGSGGPTTFYTDALDTDPPSFVTHLEKEGEGGYAIVEYTKLQLRDGTVFGYAVAGAREIENNVGVEIFKGIWIPENTPDAVFQGLEAHLTTEYSNWLRFAYAWSHPSTGASP